ncbi:hypothetical protein GPM19_00050 [Halomonas sp. ZH2S]|uniref:ABC-type transport auxiliary lipoprotein component domain-containing protein n=1 Tax=Vreelandella zhuhanensis TaxID=2684210 RepID=A0A7X3KNQ9_9GAMM|nr:ABC-type transport auxiliary lipoprotein family protein [Halomonas zhuhanensis]MWJ26610.1 hypothetical protein [Halomonas zhuhanensis]
MFYRLIYLSALLVSMLGLAACASSITPPSRYMLPGDDVAQPSQTPEYTLLLRTPRLAHYLDVEGIVMQLDDITLHEAREHQWAESLGRQLERGMRARLTQQLPSTQVLREEASHSQALTLRLEVDSFQGRQDGYAVVSGQWQLRDPQGQLLRLDSFDTRTELQSDGYPALVRALAVSWDKAAEQIAQAIRQVQTKS